ncbi:MAG: RNA pseudouridine synthase [Candidatus Marinimicrobia bacterium]|nr:RNA pseudouridine synthase [Candidatus Neomarinimicrobiota bacterium]|tara:strand:+ start:140 stop:1105 length:966 start_codon:yes stop_codon:yes gene_type:complete
MLNTNLQIINNKKDIRVDLFLSNEINDLSRSQIKKMIIDGKVLVNDKRIKPSSVLSGGESILCKFEPSNVCEQYIKPQKINFDIIFEDEYYFAINKPSGLVVHPGSGNHSNTLVNGLLYYLKDISNLDESRPGIVHRLDKDTSGVIIVAKQNQAHKKLSNLFHDRMINKKYRAIVWGDLKGKGQIKNFINRSPRNKTLFSVSKTNGRESITSYSSVQNFGPLTVVDMFPKTGRTHQLRVHMKHLGHSIFGDEKYSGGVRNIKSFHSRYSSLLKRCFKITNRHMLHAYSIDFVHPFSNRRICLEASLPSDMNNLIRLLKNDF